MGHYLHPHHRPIGRNTYTPDGDIYDFLIDPNYEYTLPENLDVFFDRSEKYLRAARVVQAVVSVLTIPLASAVCSQAAPTLEISYSLGADKQIPQISRAGIIFVSILLGLDLLLLLVLSVYGAWNRRWTGTLDSFAMMRIGASIANQVPLLTTRHVDCIKALDETPGWMGNESEQVVGKLCMGGERPLKTRRYVGYDSDYGAKPTTSENVSAAFRRGLVAVRRELRT